ncbi:hypothetical protein [Planctopirus hydrillae]|uniref:Uncharacterized protein n=1 Tax=Planctopirus hydrillae TaxID=1841610 RepID=A0A1C3E7P5_9PLAN|nr:hypothetical protein [Planctopirus hydrillae]ODA29262.1 hypothetical protein A6X21_09180 [Planctopirus hydrillae]
MTVHLAAQSVPFGPFEELDLQELAIGNGKLNISYEHAARLTFTLVAPQQERPIEYHTYLKLWIEGATVRGAAQSIDNPLFEGFVESISPDASNQLSYECYDPSYRANKEVKLFNASYTPGNPEELLWPQPAIGAVPRLVYNCKNDADDDYAHSVGQDGTVGEILAGILEYSYHPLVWRNAAPGDGTLEGAVPPYVGSELAQYDFKPQEKLVFPSEPVRSCLDRVRRYEPRMRLLWEPGSRLWRFPKIDTAPVVTIRVNDPSVTHPVLSMQMQTTIENCHTAVRIYGPETNTTEIFTWRLPAEDEIDPPANTLVPLGDPTFLETWGNSSGFFTEQTWPRWQIVDPSKRRGAKLLNDWFTASVESYQQVAVRSPVLQCSWDRGTTWQTAYGVWFDFREGIATFNGTVPYFRRVNASGGSIVPGSTQTIFAPNAMRLVWAPYSPCLQVRVPEEGFEGTAYTVAGLARELEQYDESLATGREYGVPVTTSARIAQFVKYARAQLDEQKDIVWTGGVVLDGLDFSWASLSKRVSFTSGNGGGGTQTIGWEDINAILTDVEYDLTNDQTSLTFSGDWMEQLGEDSGQLRERLKIRALEQVALFAGQTLIFEIFRTYKGYKAQQLVGVTNNYRVAYVDPETGMEQ